MKSYKDIKIGSIIRNDSHLNANRLDHLFVLENSNTSQYLIVYCFRFKNISKLLKHESFISQLTIVT